MTKIEWTEKIDRQIGGFIKLVSKNLENIEKDIFEYDFDNINGMLYVRIGNHKEFLGLFKEFSLVSVMPLKQKVKIMFKYKDRVRVKL